MFLNNFFVFTSFKNFLYFDFFFKKLMLFCVYINISIGIFFLEVFLLDFFFKNFFFNVFKKKFFNFSVKNFIFLFFMLFVI